MTTPPPQPGAHDAHPDTLIQLLEDAPTEEDSSSRGAASPERAFNRFRLLGLVGTGGMGSVYRAWDEVLDEEIALKVLRSDRPITPELSRLLRQEARLARRVNHANVVRIFELGLHEDQLYITMEYVPGRSLRRVLAEEGRLPRARAQALATAILDGLQAAHEADVLHCDLKPDNVLLGDRGRVVLTDFGISRIAGAHGGQVGGTPGYMAPEQDEPGVVDVRSDLYAFGVVLYEMLSGGRAFSGKREEIRRQKRRGLDLSALRGVPPALLEVLRRCTAWSPEHRYPTAAALRLALDEAQTQSSTSSPTSPSPTRAPLGDLSVAIRPPQPRGEVPPLIAEGLAEELIDALSTTRGLRVRPLAAVLRAPPEPDPAAFGRMLQVDVVVDGRLRAQGGRLTLALGAITTADGFQIWSQRFQVAEDALMEVAEEAAQAIAGALTTSLSPAGPRTPLTGEALDLYLRGRSELRSGLPQGTANALGLFERALALQPGDPSLLAAWSAALSRDAFFNAANLPRQLPRAIQAAEQALKLAPTSGEAWLALAQARLYQQSPAEAARALLSAIQAAPGLPRAQHLVGNLLVEVGRSDEGILRLQTALSIDPGASQVRYELIRAYALEGRWDLVQGGISEIDLRPGQVTLFTAAAIERMALWHPRLQIPALMQDLDDRPRDIAATALRWLRGGRAGQRPPDAEQVMDGGLPYFHPMIRLIHWQALAEVGGHVGDLDLGMRALRRAVDDGLSDLRWMDACPCLQALRVQPAWAELRAPVAARALAVREALDGAGPA